MRILIQNARLAFPQLFEPKSIDGGEPSYSAVLIVPPDHPAVKAVRDGCYALAKEKWGAKGEAIFKQLEAQDRLAVHDGATKSNYSGFEGNKFVSARSKVRPSVFDRNKVPLQASDGKPYAGCYVNGSIELWAQDHKSYGKRINAQLRGVQFVTDGDAFAAGSAASEDEFADLGDQGSEDVQV